MTKPQFDDFDAGILSVCQSNRYGISKPQQGDYIKRKDGQLSRITNIRQKNAQTLSGGKYEDNGFSIEGDGGSFALSTSGYMSYSGGLSAGVPLTHLRDTGNYEKARAWIWHHGAVQAHNGVDVQIRVRVWELLEDDRAVNAEIPSRYIINPDSTYNGGCQTTTYTTFDGIERVAYNENIPLADYLVAHPTYSVYTWDEMKARIKAYEDSLKTAPKEITKESYNDLFECLPPCRYGSIRGAKVFHVSERLTGDLVQWCFSVKDKYYGFTDDSTITKEQLEAHIESVLV